MAITRETLHQLVDIVDTGDIGLVSHILMRFITDDKPLPDEIEAIRQADESIAQFGTVSYAEVNWE